MDVTEKLNIIFERRDRKVSFFVQIYHNPDIRINKIPSENNILRVFIIGTWRFVMAEKVGIPRSLLYYQFYPLWKSFFEELGAEIVVSDNTTKKILNDGVKHCVDEACLPVKLLHGHVINLKNRVDHIFLPRMTSVSKGEYICPKVGGLPDMIKNSINGLPNIISTEINLRKNPHNAISAALEIGHFFLDNDSKIKKAYKTSLKEYEEIKADFLKGKLPEFISVKSRSHYTFKTTQALNIAVVGHSYTVYDSFVNMDIWQKLSNKGIRIVTIDMVDDKSIDNKVDQLPKKLFWNYGRKAVGAAWHLIDEGNLDGIIYIMSFGCGIDSFICDMIERRVRSKGDVPFIVLTIDEHSGEAGMDTRLEAFTDMILWRKCNEIDFSTLG